MDQLIPSNTLMHLMKCPRKLFRYKTEAAITEERAAAIVPRCLVLPDNVGVMFGVFEGMFDGRLMFKLECASCFNFMVLKTQS